MASPIGRFTRINSNATTNITGVILKRIVVGGTGTTWVATLNDGIGGPTILAVAITATNPLVFDMAIPSGTLSVVTSGATPGDLIVITE